MDYNNVTKQGYKIKVKWRVFDEYHVIVKREHEYGQDYIVGLNYDRKTGTWAQGLYDFRTIKEAQIALLRRLNRWIVS